MADWWLSLGTAGQIFACIAIPATVFLLLQTVLTLVGFGANHADSSGDTHGDTAGDHDFDHGHDFDSAHGDDFDMSHDAADVTADAYDGDADGAMETHADIHHGNAAFDGGLRLFTMRGLVAFFSILGWVGVVCVNGGLDIGVSVLISVTSGFAAMLIVALLLKWLFALQADGTENIRDAMGVSGTVYLRVPAQRKGQGKINAIIRGKLSEKNAVTDEQTDINYGEEVTVIGISGEDTLIVRRKNRI